MNRIYVGLFTIVLLALTACTPAGQPSLSAEISTTPTAVLITPTVTPVATAASTVAVPTPDLSRLLAEQLASGDPGHADQAVQEWINWAREESGIRAELGPQTDEILRMADQVQSALVQQILQQMRPGTKPKGMPAPLPPRLSPSLGSGQFMGLAYVLTTLAMAPGLLEPHKDGGTNPITSSQEYDQALGENAQAHAKTKSTITGSRMEFEIEMTIRAEKDGHVYEEKASGKISLNVCPDPQGNVPLDLSLQSEAGAGEVALGFQFTDHAVGHVDDEANLTSIDQEIQSEMSVTKGKNWLTGAADTSFAQVNLQLTTAGLTSGETKNWSFSNVQVSVPRSSFLVSREIVDGTMKLGMTFATMAWYTALTRAQEKWQNGYCIALVVPEGQTQRVMKGSDTHFTATVRHKFEGQELNVPVVATLTSGKVSVTPSGTKVPAPAAFRYRAPDETGQDATVQLVSRSRRGIGKLIVTFTSEGIFYQVDQIVGLPGVRITGTICALDQPFTLYVKGANAAGGTYVGSFKFAPASTSGGRWTHLATTSCLPELGCATVTGGGTYQVEDLPGGGARIMMSQATMGTSFGTATLQMAFDFELKPGSGVCSPE